MENLSISKPDCLPIKTEPYMLVVTNRQGKELLSIDPDGKFQFGPGLSQDEATQQAAQAFAEWVRENLGELT